MPKPMVKVQDRYTGLVFWAAPEHLIHWNPKEAHLYTQIKAPHTGEKYSPGQSSNRHPIQGDA